MAQTIKQKCDAIGISLPTYYLRLKNGMTPEEALSTPNKRRTSKLKPTPKLAPAPMPETEDQEPRAPVMIQYGKIKSCVFEEEYQEQRKKIRLKNAEEKTQSQRNSLNTKTNEISNLPRYQTPKPCYGPIRVLPQKQAWSLEDEAKFNNACGGYTAVILNHIKEGEFKYQIYSTKSKNKLYTNDLVKFINSIIKICDPEGKTQFRVIER